MKTLKSGQISGDNTGKNKHLHIALWLTSLTFGNCMLEYDWVLGTSDTKSLRQKMIKETLVDLKENYTEKQIDEAFEYWGPYKRNKK